MFVPVTEKERQEFFSQNINKFIPGYTGHCPTIKFHFGKSYGADTKDIIQELREQRNTRDIYKEKYRAEDYAKDILKPIERTKGQTRDLALDYTHKAPKFILGYTGFIPTMNFRYGKTFGKSADDSISEFEENQKRYYERKAEEERKIRARSAPRLTPIRSEDEVARMLKDFEDRIKFKEKELSPEYPPISGYTGHIPRIKAREESLSQRYSTAVRRSLERLREERKKKHYMKDVQDKVDSVIHDVDERTKCSKFTFDP